MKLKMIAAVDPNMGLGCGNDLLYKVPEDLKHFRATTEGHTIIMGRRTFESLPGVLPNRRHVVLTRERAYKSNHKDVVICHSIEEALQHADPFGDTFVIGGGRTYRKFMPYAHELIITNLDVEPVKADTWFPKVDYKDWKLYGTHILPGTNHVCRYYKRQVK